MNLSTPLIAVYGIGPSYARKVEKLGLKTVEDLINHYPFRYDDFSNLTQLSQVRVGEKVTLVGEIWQIKNTYTRFGRVITKAILNDGSASIELTWFNQPYLTKTLKAGDRLHISGTATKYGSKLTMIAPEWEKREGNIHTGRLVPIYPETSGISSKWFRNQLFKLVDLIKQVPDFLPPKLQDDMLSLPEALHQIHFPDNLDQAQKARTRLAFNELFLVQLNNLQIRQGWEQKQLGKTWQIDPSNTSKFINSLPFELTSGQKRVLTEIIEDLKKKVPMNRLLQGEVGSGKTVVAAAASYLAYKNGLQTLFMAPTEILAFQHHQTLIKLLSPFGVEVALYTGSQKFTPHPVPSTLYPNIIVGTHALLSKKLTTKDVGLVIIDEQHRFGVEQRSLLRARGSSPHFLTMTATPIPRTVALTIYGDLELSTIDELPQNRLPVKTHLVPENKRSDAYKFITGKVQEGDQIYVITSRIEDSETTATLKAAKAEFERLQRIMPGLRFGLLHGKMKSKEKETVLQEFRNHKLDILVSTSVVEVGVDVPNATIMVIEGANHFGLAQLHQLRGRVGRGSKQSYCLIFTDDDSLQENTRLKLLEVTNDGLKLAEEDLKIRGYGSVYGTLQHGRVDLKIANLSNLELIETSRRQAWEILTNSPSLDKYPQIKAKLAAVSTQINPD